MKVLALSFVLLAVCSAQRQGQGRYPFWPTPVEGEKCEVAFPRSCGNKTLVVERLNEPGFGANVCRKYYEVPVYSYENKRVCQYYGRRSWCGVRCSSTGRCDSTAKLQPYPAQCCDGYTTNTTIDSFQNHRHRNYRSLDCPIKLEDSVVDCLDKLGLTSLSNLLTQEGLQDTLSNQMQQLTLFAPSNEALAVVNNEDTDDLSTLLSSHAAGRKLRATYLTGGLKIPSLADGRFIHTTVVKSKDYSSRRLFVNGIEVTRGDACLARNGVVHIIDGVIMSSNNSIASILESKTELSAFNELVKKAGLARLLTKRLQTVFVPDNDSIDDHTRNCLCQPENGQALWKFLLSHVITGTAEYNTTITIRKKIYTDSCYYHYHSYHHFRSGSRSNTRCGFNVSVNNGEVSVGGSEITETDIPASNGVVHIISEPLNSKKVNLTKLCSMPPSTTAPTSPVTTSESPATTSGSPVTTSESPATTSGSPVTTSESPATTSGSPVTTSGSPATTSGSPVTTSESPATTSGSPVSTSESTSAPIATRPPEEA